MSKKKAVVSLGHEALGSTTLEQLDAVKKTAKALADLVEDGYQLTITHSNGPQVSMIHKAMTELRRVYIDYTPAPMCVCSAMSQGYVGYDIQNSLRAELLDRGIVKTVSTVLTQVTVDPYDEAFYEPTKKIGRYMSKDDAEIEIKKGNYVAEEEGKGYRRVVAAPSPIDIVEIDAGDTYAYDEEANKSKEERELKAADRIYNLLPPDQAKMARELWDEFEAMETPESKFANTLDKIQPAILNDAAGGVSWTSHTVYIDQILKRDARVHEGSEVLWEYTKNILDENVKNGNIKTR